MQSVVGAGSARDEQLPRMTSSAWPCRVTGTAAPGQLGVMKNSQKSASDYAALAPRVMKNSHRPGCRSAGKRPPRDEQLSQAARHQGGTSLASA